MNTFGYAALGAVLLVIGVLAVTAIVRSRSNDSSPGSGDGEFEGVFTLSFERSSFTPCAKPGVRYWLDWPVDVKLMDEVKRLGFDSTFVEVHLRFDGTLKTGAPGGYGHLGQYSGQVTVARLHEVTRDGPCK